MSETNAVANTPVVPCGCLVGCAKCVTTLKAEAKPNPRNEALKTMRAAIPARAISLSLVLESFDGVNAGPGTKKAGTKARTCNDLYVPGKSLQAIIDSAPESLRRYCRDCLIWDVRHGYIVAK